MDRTEVMEKKGFDGARVISFESRLQHAMMEGIRRHGGEPVSAPSLREVPLEENVQAFAFAEKLLAGRIDLLICTTGVGTRTLLEALSTRYDPKKILGALSRVTVMARGPKPVKVLKEYGVAVTLTVPEPHTWAEILEVLDTSARSISLEGKTAAVQEYGISNGRLIEGLKERGAHVLQVPVYRWDLPRQTQPLLEGIRRLIEGEMRIAVFTNSVQVQHLLRFASGEGLEKPLREGFKRVVVASVGPTTSEALLEEGISVDFEPSRPEMEVLIQELAQAAGELIRQKQEGPIRSTARFRNLTVNPPALEEGRDSRRDSLFMKACRREPVPATPVWFMRQAGRYLKEYRRIRNQVPFLELCKDKELAAEVTVLAAERLKADAAIVFSDLLLIVEPLGLGLEYGAENGPVVTGRLNSPAGVDRLKEVEPEESLGFVFETVRLARAALDPKIPLIGFSGAPFTLAAYMLEGGSSRLFLRTKEFMVQEPEAWKALMEKLSRGIVKYLNGQIEAGADAVQLFDTWVGCLGPDDYRRYVLPYTQAVLCAVKAGVPTIHFSTGTGAFLEEIREAGGDVVGVDWKVRLDEAWRRVGYEVGIQGNLDPAALLGPRQQLRARVLEILDQAQRRPGHIFNLGHGVLPSTPEENVIALVEMVHEMSRR